MPDRGVGRAHVLRYRVHAQGLDAKQARPDASVLDLGVQDTGPDGSAWALELRRCSLPADDLFLAWTLRGAPHAYRRSEAAGVAAATWPWSDTDAAKRIFDAATPLRTAGIGILDALSTVAGEMRDVVRSPTVKGELSAALTERLEAPYLRYCRACEATHTYEQPFRIAGLHAGLELEAGTSPPVLRRLPGWRGPAKKVPAHLDPVRATLHLLGPATPKLVAGYLDTTVREVAAHWPDDVVPVIVDGQELQVLAADEPALRDPPAAEGVLLLGPFDLFLQGRDRELVVPDPAARKDLWRTLGRPGAILDGHDLVGSWRPRTFGARLKIEVRMWSGGEPPSGLAEQAERLADFRGKTFAGLA
ncbi:DNA glycosylase AlkZ-like family protein [Nocardioides sp. LHG3406-4]|uniref:DNA glycosylase AlkZ-like family protein n=1 Tax=Nocardioides sp. LHG3406-4 TaxID=2804575 RepID=UPI003CFAB809